MISLYCMQKINSVVYGLHKWLHFVPALIVIAAAHRRTRTWTNAAAERRLDSHTENRKTIITSHIIYLLRDLRSESRRTMLHVDSYRRLIYRCPEHANAIETNCREVSLIEYMDSVLLLLLLVLHLMAYWPTKPMKFKLNKLHRNR